MSNPTDPAMEGPDAAAAALGRLRGDIEYNVVEPSNIHMDDDGELTEGAAPPSTASADPARSGGGGTGGSATGGSAMGGPDAAAAALGRLRGDIEYNVVEPSNIHMDDDGNLNQGVSSGTTGTSGGTSGTGNASGTSGSGMGGPDAAAAALGRLRGDIEYNVVEPSNIHMDDDGNLGPSAPSTTIGGMSGSGNASGTSGSGMGGPDAAAAALGRLRGDIEYNVVEPSNIHMDDDGELTKGM